jgi:hypothetical protein
MFGDAQGDRRPLDCRCSVLCVRVCVCVCLHVAVGRIALHDTADDVSL